MLVLENEVQVGGEVGVGVHQILQTASELSGDADQRVVFLHAVDDIVAGRGEKLKQGQRQK